MDQWTAEPHGIVKDIIDSIPPNSIKIKYDSGVEANHGNELTPTQVQNQPTLFEYPVEANALYTVVMIDPDAPSRLDQSMGQIIHWLVINVPGSDVSRGELISFYAGSGPSEGNGLHRYIFLVFKQAGQICKDEYLGGRSGLSGRLSFMIREFASKYNLGQPIAGNFYQAQYDDYVPIMRAKFANLK